MPSITYWNRLEARSRSHNLRSALAARVHDPAWLLARQWQLGEFQGEDAASPAYMKLVAELVPFAAWSAGDSGGAIDRHAPLELPLLAERFSADDATTAAELGRVFERVLVAEDADADDVLVLFRAAYSFAPRSDDDSDAARLRALWNDRLVDGLALYRAAKAAHPALPAPAVPAAHESAVRTALVELVQATEGVYGGAFDTRDPPGWNPARLEYDVTVALADRATSASLNVHASRDGRLDWYAFDVAATAPATEGAEVRSLEYSVIPAAVQFRGMPRPRWWDFEDGRVDFGALSPDRRDLARLLFMEFMLVHGNDWFVIPFEQPLGTACRISSLVVRDVFGGDLPIQRADTASRSSARRWSLFATSNSIDGGLADFFLVPPSAGPALQLGPDVEDVRFLRDQTANMVWAVEHATESRLGEAHFGMAGEPAKDSPDPRPRLAELRYTIQTRVHPHWIPFIPIKLDLTSSEIALELAAVLDPTGLEGSAPLTPAPRGRVLQPTNLEDATSYRVREEEVPREGTRVVRSLHLTRWTDGSSHLWIARRKSVGTGEGSSGLGFDRADPVR